MNVHIGWEDYLGRFQEPAGYLDFARVGPISRDVAATLTEAADLSRGAALARFERSTSQAAASAATLLKAAGHEVAFVSSTSHGLFAVAAALPGDGTVLVPRGEFPANTHPWLRFQDRGGPRVRWIDAAPITPDVLAAHLTPEVRALTVSAVDALTGYRAPLGALKEVLGPDRLLIVDAIQGLGAVPIEVEAADVLACGGQKWLRAGWGAALLLVRDHALDRLAAGLGGWSGLRDAFDIESGPLPGAVAHTMTNPDHPAVAALGAGIDLLLAAGPDAVGRRVTETLDEMLRVVRAAGAHVLLPELGPAERGGIASFRLPGADPAEAHAALTAAGLVTTLRGGWIRLSPHATTPRETATRLARALSGAHVPEGKVS
ncbi:aminotransferase class V-fold PLP-dependent enzyme [Sphaerisporangium fuscum]|uniref:aminotransferase class V-fold PLP-dependent enzyme n=1 Tax=Sphaerisporangium fuscum TaxID=2835868 RepID=UPI002029AB75|nr:aminotransferase class V-fold PLP-dependent enzyme [Sphaerisporangium fuscum]